MHSGSGSVGALQASDVFLGDVHELANCFSGVAGSLFCSLDCYLGYPLNASFPPLFLSRPARWCAWWAAFWRADGCRLVLIASIIDFFT